MHINMDRDTTCYLGLNDSTKKIIIRSIQIFVRLCVLWLTMSSFEFMCPLCCSVLKVYGVKDSSGVHWFRQHGKPNGKELTEAWISHHSH